ncbi:DM13 domain-containing protein [Nocardia noduli]|uniref:DM13 domain-containing protein n=1 Tax=Nocardia noduli TaxID=2815722 RepID=UPI001C23D88D|nr:DM13 domain-containing protein [Nocardia noduli]
MVSVARVVRSPLAWIVAAVVVAFGATAIVLLEPWKLIVDTTVNEAAPTAAVATGPGTTPVAGPVVLAEGTFVSHEHHTSGTVRVLRLPDGSRVLRLEDLDTSDGPDVRVWLTDQTVTDDWFTFDDGHHVDLGSLKGNKGNQNYAVPAELDLAAFVSADLWCDRFNVSFGAATLVRTGN